MSQTSQQPPPAPSGRSDQGVGKSRQVPAPRAAQPAAAPVPSTAFRSWARFGAVVMAMMGTFWVVLGLSALLGDGTLRGAPADSLLAVQTYTAWGWVHLLGGLLAIFAGLRILLSGDRWARAAGLFVAWLSAMVNLAFLNITPVWSAMLIALDIVVIYALTVHGAELENRSPGRS